MMTPRWIGSAGVVVLDATRVSLTLFRIMVPVILVVKVLDLLGVVGWIASAFEPLMGLVGLPGDMGLVWATAVLTNMYGGIVLFASTAPGLGLTTAQVTVIACMILVAHSMPVEIAIARKAGVRMRFMIPFRLLSALLLGFLLHRLFCLGGFLDGPARILWEASGSTGGLGAWGLSQLRNLAAIFLIVLGLIVLMRILDASGFTTVMNRALKPLLTSMGIGGSASTVTILGMVLGISYGGGLIIRAVSTGKVPPRDVFFSMSLMGLSHSIVEDSLLMMSLGASLWGVLPARLAFTWPVIALLVTIVGRIPDGSFFRWLFVPPQAGREPGPPEKPAP